MSDSNLTSFFWSALSPNKDNFFITHILLSDFFLALYNKKINLKKIIYK